MIYLTHGFQAMAEESIKDQGNAESAEKKEVVAKKKQKGIISRLWNGIFRVHGDDFEKRLQHISKEEAAALSRLKRRSQRRRRILRNLLMVSALAEVNITSLFRFSLLHVCQMCILELKCLINTFSLVCGMLLYGI
uniref:Uncharacterized protein n=1 Tax=Kalanchoe fedtschenkoi TaxID=63787 RepID=A0A7N0VE07_KALFE